MEIQQHFFNNDAVRVFGTNDNPIFVMKDVADILGIQDYRHRFQKLRPQMRVDNTTVFLKHSSLNEAGLRVDTQLITEMGLYYFIMRSNSELAQPFQDWVCGDLLPSIRRQYITVLEEKTKELQATVSEQNIRINELRTRPKLSKLEHIKVSDRLIHLGVLTQDEYDYIMRSVTRNIDGETRDCFLQVKKHFQPHLLRISKRLSKVHKTMHEDTLFTANSRNNLYTQTDYEEWGDVAIIEYLIEYPPETWGCGLTWGAPGEYLEMINKRVDEL